MSRLQALVSDSGASWLTPLFLQCTAVRRCYSSRLVSSRAQSPESRAKSQRCLAVARTGRSTACRGHLQLHGWKRHLRSSGRRRRATRCARDPRVSRVRVHHGAERDLFRRSRQPRVVQWRPLRICRDGVRTARRIPHRCAQRPERTGCRCRRRVGVCGVRRRIDRHIVFSRAGAVHGRGVDRGGGNQYSKCRRWCPSG